VEGLEIHAQIWSLSPLYAAESASSKPESQASRPRKRARKKARGDFWTQTQNMKDKMFEEDLEDTTRYHNPLIRQVPTLRPEDSPCEFKPSAGAGFKTNCKW